MWSISAKANIIHTLFITFILALNQLPWISGLSDILLIINEISVHKFDQRRILKSFEHLRWSFLPKQLIIFTKSSILAFDQALNTTQLHKENQSLVQQVVSQMSFFINFLFRLYENIRSTCNRRLSGTTRSTEEAVVWRCSCWRHL